MKEITDSVVNASSSADMGSHPQAASEGSFCKRGYLIPGQFLCKPKLKSHITFRDEQKWKMHGALVRIILKRTYYYVLFLLAGLFHR